MAKDSSNRIKKIKVAGTEYDLVVDKNWTQTDENAVDFIDNKPFETIDTSTLAVSNGVLGVKEGLLNQDSYSLVVASANDGANLSLHKNENLEGQAYLIKGEGGTEVTADASGNITIKTDMPTIPKPEDQVKWEGNFDNTNGTKIGTLTIGDTEKEVYTPSATNVEWEGEYETGIKIGTLTISGTEKEVYAPAAENVTLDGNNTYTLKVGSSNTTTSNVTTDGNTYVKLIDDTNSSSPEIDSKFKIVGGGATKVTSDATGTVTITTDLPESGDKVEWTQSTQAADGTKIATIKINETSTDVYTPKVEWDGNFNNTNGTKIGTITINGTETVVYAPAATGGDADGNTTYEIFAGYANSYGNQDTSASVGGQGPYLKLFKKELGDTAPSRVSQHQIRGEGGLKINSDSSGNIIFDNPPAAEIAPDLTSTDTTKVETLKIYETTREEYETATNIEDTSLYLVPDPPTVTIVSDINGAGEVVEVETLKIYTTTKKQYENTPVADLEDNSLYLIPDPSAWTIETIENAGHVDLIVADKTEYYLPNAISVTINAPTDTTKYECWISIGGTNPTINLPATMECVGVDNRNIYSNIDYTEISIKNGKYVVGCVGT